MTIFIQCFCDSRVIEGISYSNCMCDNLYLQAFQCSLCTVCRVKMIRNRRKIKNILLCIRKKTPNDFYYNNSVNIFVQREIKFEN